MTDPLVGVFTKPVPVLAIQWDGTVDRARDIAQLVLDNSEITEVIDREMEAAEAKNRQPWFTIFENYYVTNLKTERRLRFYDRLQVSVMRVDNWLAIEYVDGHTRFNVYDNDQFKAKFNTNEEQ